MISGVFIGLANGEFSPAPLMRLIPDRIYLTIQAGVSLMPRKRTLPVMTRLLRDCISSGIEVE